MKKYRNNFSRGFYRSRNGMIMGVCAGIAEYFDFSVFWVRTIALILLLFSGFWPILILYVIATLLMKKEPAAQTHMGKGYDSYFYSRKGMTDRIKRRFDNLERRIYRMEDSF